MVTYIHHLGADGWHVGFWDAKGKWNFAHDGKGLTRPKAQDLMRRLNGGSNAVPDTNPIMSNTVGDVSMDPPV